MAAFNPQKYNPLPPFFAEPFYEDTPIVYIRGKPYRSMHQPIAYMYIDAEAMIRHFHLYMLPKFQVINVEEFITLLEKSIGYRVVQLVEDRHINFQWLNPDTKEVENKFIIAPDFTIELCPRPTQMQQFIDYFFGEKCIFKICLEDIMNYGEKCIFSCYFPEEISSYHCQLVYVAAGKKNFSTNKGDDQTLKRKKRFTYEPVMYQSKKDIMCRSGN